MQARAHVEHSIRGRTRLRIPERRGDRAFFREIETRLSAIPAVHSVETNPLTGSVLVHHAEDVERLLLQAASNGLGELVELVLSLPPMARQVRADVAAIDRAVRRFTAGGLDLATLASLGCFTMAGIQLVRGRQPVRAASLAWYGSELLLRWNGDDQGAE